MKIVRKPSLFCLYYLFIILSPFLTLVFANASEFTREWGNLGLYGGQIYDFEFDPTNPDRIFAGAYYGDGLFLSTDSGATWQPVLTGAEGGEFEGEATFRNSAVWAVKSVPLGGGRVRVWAVHNFWAEWADYEADGSANWHHILNGQMQRECTNCVPDDQWRFCRSLAVDPGNPDRAYVGTGGPFAGAANGAIYRTDDGGDSWTKTGMGASNEFNDTVTDIAINYRDSKNLWAITGENGNRGTLYHTSDYGVKWSEVISDDFTYNDLELWPTDPTRAFVATATGILSNISGSWQYIYSGYVRALAFDPQNAKTLYAVVGSYGMIRGEYNTTTRKFNFGDITDVNLDFLTLEVDPADGNVVFGGEVKKGVFKLTYIPSGDDFTVSEQNNGINAITAYDIDVIPAGESSPAYLIAATGIGVSYRVGDGGWTVISATGLPDELTYSVAFDPTVSDGSSFYVGGEGFLAKVETSDRGKTWKVVNLNTSAIPWYMRVSDIAVDANGSTLYLTTHNFISNGGRVYKSTDSGDSLEQILSSPAYDFNAVIIDPTDSDHVLAGGGNFYAPRVDGNLHVSFDAGATWSLTNLRDVIVNALLVDPDDPGVIYAGCGYSGGTLVPLYKSTDKGDTWQPSYDGIPGRPARHGIWGSASNDVWVLGHSGSIVKGGYDDMRIMHFDGENWSDDMPENQSNVLDHLKGIWGASGNDIYAVGENGASVHYDGLAWSPMEEAGSRTTNQNLNAVWGYSTNSVYAVGEAGTILLYDGKGWSIMNSTANAHLYGVWGHNYAGSHRAYAVGATGTILRFEGGSWSTMDSGVRASLFGIWSMPDGSAIYAVGDPEPDLQGDVRYTILQNTGSSWSRMSAPIVAPGRGRLNAVWGTSPDDVFAVGDDGVILHYDGRDWTQMISNTTADLLSVWGASANQVYAVGRQGTIQFYDGSKWNPKDFSPTDGQIESIASWNAVTDLKFKLDPGGNRMIYAATDRQGVYFSPNQGQSWVNLLSPPYSVYALAVGSIYVASSGVHTYQGIGYIVGEVRDALTGVVLSQATVSTEIGVSDTTDSNGLYLLPLVAGLYNVTGDAAGYKPETAENVSPKKDGNIVNFFLTDPPVYVKIDDIDIVGTNGVFVGAAGNIRPVDGEYGWTENGANGILQVPYQHGWVQLAIEPHAGNQVMDVLVNDNSQGPISNYTFEKPVKNKQRIEARFGPLTSLCKADIDQDGDVDGSDAASFALGVQNGATIVDLAGELGRTDCLP